MGISPLSPPRAGSFQPSRMLAARLRRSFTVNALAEAMGSHRSTNFRHGVGLFTPNQEHLRAAARALRFPERFFLGDDIGELAPATASFRASSKVSASARDAALGSAALAIAFNGEIERLFALPELDFPDVSRRREPDKAAEAVRWKWRLEGQPIGSTMQLLESKGVRVFSLPADALEVDTFSLWHRDKPFVLLNCAKRSDELRFDLARELGHLLLHRHGTLASRKAQQAATEFASAFLMPAAALLRDEVSSSFEIDQLRPLASKWGAPSAVVAQRLNKLRILSDWQYRKLGDQLGEQTIASDEQQDAELEKSYLLRRVFASLRAQGVTKQKIASTVHIYPKDLDELTFGLALRNPDETGIPDATPVRLRPRLTFVDSKT